VGLLALVGFNKLRWQSPSLLLLAEMELDFGGIGEQYAVNRAYDLAVARRSNPFLINFSGDLRANRPLASGGDDFKWIRRALGYGMASATAYVRLRENVHCLSDTVAAGRDRNRYGSAHDES